MLGSSISVFSLKWRLDHCHDNRADYFGDDLRLSCEVFCIAFWEHPSPLHHIPHIAWCYLLRVSMSFKAHKKQLKRQNAANHLLSAGCLSIILQGEMVPTNQLLALDKDCKHCYTSRCWMRCWPSASWKMNTKKHRKADLLNTCVVGGRPKNLGLGFWSKLFSCDWVNTRCQVWAGVAISQ